MDFSMMMRWQSSRPRQVLPSGRSLILCVRTGLGRAALKCLAEADAFGSLGLTRRESLWQALAQDKKPKAMPLFDPPDRDGLDEGGLSADERHVRQVYDDDEPLPEALPAMNLAEEVFADYQTVQSFVAGSSGFVLPRQA